MIWIIVGWLIALPLSVALIYLSVELVLGLARLPLRETRQRSPLDGRLAILVPAHDEAAGIAATVASIRDAAPAARLLVVADNCTDDTARLARNAGAEVIERLDAERRGKGHALAHGRACLAADPPSAVLVIDADCRLRPGVAERLGQSAVTQERPVQCANILDAHPSDSPMKAISNFAFLIKNVVRARALKRLGGGGLLFGTGMAFPWPVFEQLPLATSDAVEDLQLGLWLAAKGIPVEFDDSVRVTSPPAPVEATHGQRSRWEHGYMGTALKQALPLLARGITQRSRNQAMLGAHLLIPPLALLIILSVGGAALLAAMGALTGYWWPVAAITGSLALAGALLVLAWWKEGRDVLSFMTLLRVPAYMLWKAPIYVKFFTNRQTGWNRTRRAD